MVLQRFLISGPDLRIDAAKRSKQGQSVHRFSISGPDLRIDAAKRSKQGQSVHRFSISSPDFRIDAHNLSFRGLSRIDSRFQAQTCESMQPKGQNKGNPCSTSSARVPSRVDDASCLRCLASHELDSSLTAVRQWRQKRVLMRPEAAFPYVFAAEGAQHPPKQPPRSTPCRHEIIRRHEKNRRHAQRAV